MKTAKIIRHRHRYEYYMNNTIHKVEEEMHYKILFSDPKEQESFHKWVEENGGSYLWNKEKNMVTEESFLPSKLDWLKEDSCWCDVGTWYILHIVYYRLFTISSPYNAEIYVKD